MALPSFFKTPRPRIFNYVPVYYNKEKEELEERRKRIEQEVKVEQGENQYASSIRRGKMRGYFKSPTQQKRSSNIRLLVILFVLVLAFLWIMQKA